MDDTPNAKRQRIFDDLMLSDQSLLPEEDPNDTTPLSCEELVNIGYNDCYACKYLNVESMVKNDKYLFLMKLYTQNASTITRDAIFIKIKEYFDKYIKSDLIQIEKSQLEMEGKHVPPDNEIVVEDWTLQCIKDHFIKHTNFPTDEILNQIRIKRALRARLSDNLVEVVNTTGKQVFDMNNIKLLITIEKEIQNLLKLKREIPSMVGYCQSLDY